MTASLQYAASPEHEPFFWRGGPRAALLIHGFPGSPAEMRPLGELIHARGWSVHSLLLPGFGRDIATLARRRHTDWSAAINVALRELQRDHGIVVLIGYSVGGTLALRAALDARAAGVVALAPFWSAKQRWISLAWPLIQRLRPKVRLLKHADFSTRELREALKRMYTSIDLDDPVTQQKIRGLELPSSAIGEILKVGGHLARNIRKLTAPALIIQGTQDTVTLPQQTRSLVAKFANPPLYHELQAGHDLLNPRNLIGAMLEQQCASLLIRLQPVCNDEYDLAAFLNRSASL